MYCQKCGTQNDDAANLCVKCGTSLVIAGTAPAVATHVYAGFWKRFAAFIIDYIVVIVAAFMIGALIGVLYGVFTGTAGGAEGIGALSGLAFFWLYYALMESSRTQATLGKMALGIKVTDQRGGRISFGRASGRLLGKILSGMILMIGYLMAGFTAKKQALHDMIAGSLVVNKGATEAELQAGVVAPTMPGWAIVLVVLGAMVVPAGIIAAIAIPAYQDSIMRFKVNDAILAGSAAKVAVREYYDKNEKWPGDLKEAGLTEQISPHARSVTLEPRTGAIRIVLAQSPFEGKSIFFVPQVEKTTIKWQCRSDDVPQRYLPYDCRDATAKP